MSFTARPCFFEYKITAAYSPGDLESIPLFSSVSRGKAFSFQGGSISLFPCFVAAAVVCEALQRVYSNSLYLSCAITQKANTSRERYFQRLFQCRFGVYSIAMLFPVSLWVLSMCCIPCKRKVLFLSLQAFTYGVITPIVILGFQKGSKQRFCTPLCRTKSVVSECKSLLLTCIIMLSLWLSSL